jgi:hypothetical protein
MNPRKLIPLVVVLLVLVVLVLLFGRKKPQEELRLEAGFTRLAPKDFLASDIDRLEIFLGSQKNQKVKLQREASGWRVKSYHNGPGNAEKVSGLLEKLKTLEGEFRVSEKSVHKDFDLTEETAVHVSAYKPDTPEPWFHLLVGKSLPNGGFVRIQGEDAVYVIDTNLRGEFGLLAGDPSKTPEQLPWIDRKIIAVRKEDVERLSITWPDRKTVFVKQAKADSASEAPTEETSQGKKATTADELEWVAEDPPAPFPLKKTAVDQVLDALVQLMAEDIVDPEEKEEKGLDEPSFRCTLGLGQEQRTLIASHPDPLQEGYMMVEGGDGTLFKLSRYWFEQVFKKGGDLFELPALTIDKQAIRRISLTWPERTIVFGKKASGEVTILSGSSKEEKLRQEKATSLWDSLARIAPADFSTLHPERDRGLEKPRFRALIKLKTGKGHVITLGDEARGVAGRYMKIDDDPHIYVIAKSDLDRIFPPMDQLFEQPASE